MSKNPTENYSWVLKLSRTSSKKLMLMLLLLYSWVQLQYLVTNPIQFFIRTSTKTHTHEENSRSVK